MDAQQLRKDFPIFSQNGQGPLVYLDSAATTQKPSSVIKAISDFYSFQNATPHRGVYALSEQATMMYEGARQKVADFLHAVPEEIVFTSGTTEGINFIADTWAKENIVEGDQILITHAEHHANILPWMRLAEKSGAQLRFIPFDTQTHTLRYPCNDEKEPLINKRTKIVAVTLDSNVIGGSVWVDQEQLMRLISDAHAEGAKVLLDAAQFVPHASCDVEILKPDFLVFSAHKMLGPTGIGVLYINRELLDHVPPYQVGGSMVYSVTTERSIWNKPPSKFEAGTPPIAQAVGLVAAIDYLQKLDWQKLSDHETHLCNIFLDGLTDLPGIRILGDQERIRREGHLVSFVVQGLHAHDAASYLGSKGVAVRAGHHCAQILAALLDANASLRISFYLYNTTQDIISLLEALQEALTFLKK
jgi:cysteine desulfurase/selenocysteine lyase